MAVIEPPVGRAVLGT